MPRRNNISKLSDLILDLQRTCREIPFDTYCDWVMRRLQTNLHFDAGLWRKSCAKNEKTSVLSTYLFNRPAELLENRISNRERNPTTFPLRLLNNKAVSWSCQDGETSQDFNDFTQHWRINQAIAITSTDPLTGLHTTITLWRDDIRHPFIQSECEFFENITPHLIETSDICRITHLARIARNSNEEIHSSAIANINGQLLAAPQNFIQMIRTEWPDWHGPLLPPAMRHLATKQEETRFCGRNISVVSLHSNGVFLLQTRKKQPRDELTPREIEIADCLASGMTSKETARVLEIAPATVRNHIATIFRKLNVNSQPAMVWEIRRTK